MGAWRFVAEPPPPGARARRAASHVARDESGSPASGSQTVHDREQDDLLAAGRSAPTPCLLAPWVRRLRCLGGAPGAQPILPIARAKPMETRARMPWTTLKPADSSWPAMMTMRLIQT